MGGVYRRGTKLWIWYFDANGKRMFEPMSARVGEEARARKILKDIERRVETQKRIGIPAGDPTVAGYYRAWIEERKAEIQTWRNDEGVFRLHVLPAVGPIRLDEVKPSHLVALVRDWRTKMAPKSVHNAYSSLSAFSAMRASPTSSMPPPASSRSGSSGRRSRGIQSFDLRPSLAAPSLSS